MSPTDPDATPMRTKHGTSLGYHDHYVVDGGKRRIILTAFFGRDAFAYDAEADVYRCPRGQSRPRRKIKYTEQEVMYRADTATCNACPVKASCTGSDHGRMVHRSFYAEYLDRVRSYHVTESYKKAIRKRQVWVEPLFAEAKEWHGLRRLRLRGLENANIQGMLIAAGQNLKRLLAATGWGRRHTPPALPRGVVSAFGRLRLTAYRYIVENSQEES